MRILSFFIAVGLLFGMANPTTVSSREFPLTLEACFTTGIKVDAASRLDGSLDEDDREWIRDEVQDTAEDLQDVRREYTQVHRELQDQVEDEFSSSQIESIAEDLGELEGERLGLHLNLEMKLKKRLGSDAYKQYRDSITKLLEDRINSRHQSFAREVYRGKHHDSASKSYRYLPLISLADHSVNFCPSLPEPDLLNR